MQHRQELFGLFKHMVYAETEDEFKRRQIELEEAELSRKFPQFLVHLQRRYAHRVETWALFVRKMKNLPTRGSNTNNYCEASMKTTKEQQFGRVRTFNLPELLSVICDDSKIFQKKLIDIGHNRDTAQKQSKSKYLGKKSNISKELIVDIGGEKYMVPSETDEDKWYMLDMRSGFCQCPAGTSCAPCKHKAAVADHFGKASFTVTPTSDPCQRALYHFIAMGRTMPAHYYRNNDDSTSIPDGQGYIEAHIAIESEKAHADLDTSTMVVDEDDNETEEFDSDLVATNFSEAMNAYRDKILDEHRNARQDPATNKAMMAMTKSLKRAIKCTPTTHQHQMHNFAKGTTRGNRTKRGSVIKVNPPAIASRKFKVPGRGQAPLGRPLKDRAGRLQFVVTEDGDMIARSDKPLNETPKKSHSLAKIVSNNETLPKSHTKQ